MESAQVQSIMQLQQLAMELTKEATLTGLSEIHGDQAGVRLVISEFSQEVTVASTRMFILQSIESLIRSWKISISLIENLFNTFIQLISKNVINYPQRSLIQ